MTLISYVDVEEEDEAAGAAAVIPEGMAGQVFRAPFIWQVVRFLDGGDVKRLERLNRGCYRSLNSREDAIAVMPTLDLTYCEKSSDGLVLRCRKSGLCYRNGPERCARIVMLGDGLSGLGVFEYLISISGSVERLFLSVCQLPEKEIWFPRLRLLYLVVPVGRVPFRRWSICAPQLRMLVGSSQTDRWVNVRGPAGRVEFFHVPNGFGDVPGEFNIHRERCFIYQIRNAMLFRLGGNDGTPWNGAGGVHCWIPPVTPSFWMCVVDVLREDESLLGGPSSVYYESIDAAAAVWDAANWTVAMVYHLRHIIGALWKLFECVLPKGYRVAAGGAWAEMSGIGIGFSGCPTIPSDTEAFRFAFCCQEVPLIMFPSYERQTHTFPHTPTPLLTHLETLHKVPLSIGFDTDPLFPFRKWSWRQVIGEEKDRRTPILKYIRQLDEEEQQVWRRLLLPYEEWEQLLRNIPPTQTAATAATDHYRRPTDADWVMVISEMRRTSGYVLRRILRTFHISHVIIMDKATQSLIATWYYYGKEAARTCGSKVRVIFSSCSYLHPVALDVMVDMAEGNYRPGQSQKLSAIESTHTHPVCAVNVIQFRYFISSYSRLRRSIDINILADIRNPSRFKPPKYKAQYDKLTQITESIMAPAHTLRNELWINWGLKPSFLAQCRPEEIIASRLPLWRQLSWPQLATD